MSVFGGIRIILSCLAVSFVLAGCGGDSSNSSGSNDSGSNAASTTAQTTPAPIKDKFDRPSIPGAHPDAHIEQLVVRDVVKGKGDELNAGDRGYFNFIVSNYDTGKLMDQAWNRKPPFSTQIEQGVVIDGWWQGVPGMRVGGRRVLIIPPSLGFTGNENVPEGTTTYFVIDLLGVIPAEPRGTGQTTTTPGAATTPPQ